MLRLIRTFFLIENESDIFSNMHNGFQSMIFILMGLLRILGLLGCRSVIRHATKTAATEKLRAVWFTSNAVATTVFLLFFCCGVWCQFPTPQLSPPQPRWQTDRHWLATKEPLS
jgi:hypothetical protein